MDNMTNNEFKFLFNAIIQILKDNNVDASVIKKIEDLHK